MTKRKKLQLSGPKHQTSGAVQVQQRVFTFYRTPGSYKTSDDEDEDRDVTKIELDLRHYCRRCKRKRNESKMEKVGKGAFGKDSWECSDDKASCRKIANLKGRQ